MQIEAEVTLGYSNENENLTLITEIENQSKNSSEVPIIKSEEKGEWGDPKICKFCQKTFTKRKSLMQHLRIHTGENRSNNSLACQVCRKSFPYKSYLTGKIL